MEVITKKYIKVNENVSKITDLEVYVGYSLGGMNYFTGRPEQRGYYIGVTPVERSRGFISFGAFTGTKFCVNVVNRKSKKAEAEAKEKAAQVEKILIEHVCKENGLTVAEVVRA